MILLCKLAAAVLVAAVLTLLLKKDQPAFALLVSVCTAAGLLAVAMHQIEPLLAWLRTLEVYFQGQSLQKHQHPAAELDGGGGRAKTGLAAGIGGKLRDQRNA